MQLVLEKFPKWRSEIEQLSLESADFRELCQDYEEVRSLVEIWVEDDVVGQDTIDDYQRLLNDLEMEIMEELEARFGTADSPDRGSTSKSISLRDQESDAAERFSKRL